MGERLSCYGGSSVDVSAENNNDDDSPMQTSASTSNVNSGSGTLPRSRIPSPTKRLSETGLPLKNASSSIPSTPKKLSCEENRESKSRIPVLRSSSYRVPKTISFGFGVPKVFPMHAKKSDGCRMHWHQVNSSKKSVASSIENADFEDMKMALEWNVILTCQWEWGN